MTNPLMRRNWASYPWNTTQLQDGCLQDYLALNSKIVSGQSLDSMEFACQHANI